jgi:hypothetical protein
MKKRRWKKATFSVDLAMLHLSGLTWTEIFQYKTSADACKLSSHEIQILAAGAEHAYEGELIKAVR